MNNLTTSNSGRTFIGISEGIRRKMYLDDKGNPTIGIGHLITANERWLMTAILNDQQIADLFDKDATSRELWLNQNTVNWDKPILQCQFDALMDFIWQYDIYKYDDTRHAIINGNTDEICKQLMMFVNETKGSGDGKLLPRRQREINLFTHGIYT